MTVAGALPGAARLVLADGVTYLDPAPAVFEAMLDGWAVQQRCRLLKPGTVSGRLDLVRRVKEFSNQYPWQWQPAEVEAFFDHLLAGQRPIRESTARNYQNALRLFCDYITDARYGWPATCVERFGQAPTTGNATSQHAPRTADDEPYRQQRFSAGTDRDGRWKCKERGEWPDMGDSPALDGERSTLCVKA